jgi:hypothetical protein
LACPPVLDLCLLHGGEVRRGSIPKLGSSEAAAATEFPSLSSSSLASLRGSGEDEPLLCKLGAEVAGDGPLLPPLTAPTLPPCPLSSRQRLLHGMGEEEGYGGRPPRRAQLQRRWWTSTAADDFHLRVRGSYPWRQGGSCAGRSAQQEGRWI